MELTTEQIDAYKKMGEGKPTMEMCIHAWLAANCEKFDDTKLERCFKHLKEVASEMLDGKDGEVPDETCYRICLDYFDDEIWRKEDEEIERKEKERQAAEAKRKAKDKIKKTKQGEIFQFKSSIEDVKKEPAKEPAPKPATEPKPKNELQLSLF